MVLKQAVKKATVLKAVSLFIILTVLYIVSSIDMKQWLQSKGLDFSILQLNPKSYVAATVKGLPFALFSGNNLEVVRINIKFKEWLKISEYQKEAYKDGIINKKYKKNVKGSIEYQGNKLKAKIRLKGDWRDHVNNNKWSLRIKLKSGYLFGSKEFSLQSPKTRDYQSSIIFNEMMKDLEIMTPHMRYVKEILNGEDRGIMAYQEHFTKNMIERNGRKDSVILKFDEGDLWQSRIDNKIYENSYSNADLTAFKLKKIYSDKTSLLNYEAAVGLLRGFIDGTLAADRVFDIKTMSRYIALSDAWGDSHGLTWHNLRFYYNPMSSRLEPVGYDQLAYHTIESPSQEDKFIVKIMKNPYIKLAYIEALKQIKSMLNNSDYYQKLSDIDAKNEEILRAEFLFKPPKFLNFVDVKNRLDKLLSGSNGIVYYKERGRLKTKGWVVDPFSDKKVELHYLQNGFHKLRVANEYSSALKKYNPTLFGLTDVKHGFNVVSDKKIEKERAEIVFLSNKPNIEGYYKLARAYLIESSNFFGIEVYNSTPYALKVSSVILNDNTTVKLDGVVIPPKKLDETPVPLRIPFKNELKDRLLNTELIIFGKRVKVKQYPSISNNGVYPHTSLEEVLNTHKFLSVNVQSQSLSVAEGVWNVLNPIIVPEGYSFNIGKNTVLKFSKDSYIFTTGEVNIVGEDKSAVLLDSESPDQSWGGIHIMSTSSKNKTVFSNMHINNTHSLSYGSMVLTGGVTIYNSDFKSENLKITLSQSEDALNIVNSKFKIDRLTIDDTYSDGLDTDFSHGEISNSRFINIGRNTGGDAVDFSGSKIVLSDAVFTDIEDKAVSAGEGSDVLAKNLNINNSANGIVAKDNSSILISNSHISNIKFFEIMAYMKKNQFENGGSINAIDISFSKVDPNFVSDFYSNVKVNGNLIENKQINTKDLYKTIMKSSREK